VRVVRTPPELRRCCRPDELTGWMPGIDYRRDEPRERPPKPPPVPSAPAGLVELDPAE